MQQQLSARGFTLVETLVASGVLITAIAGLAHLFTLSVRFTRDSGQFGAALVAAQDKLETLRSLRFAWDDNGNVVTDARLQSSPPTSLHQNVDGYFEWLDRNGTVVAERGALFVRRWRVTGIHQDEPAAIAIDVCVYDAAVLNADPSDASACVATVRVRQP
jgi:type II secretory pathway pseudopilin PulG